MPTQTSTKAPADATPTKLPTTRDGPPPRGATPPSEACSAASQPAVNRAWPRQILKRLVPRGNGCGMCAPPRPKLSRGDGAHNRVERGMTLHRICAKRPRPRAITQTHGGAPPHPHARELQAHVVSMLLLKFTYTLVSPTTQAAARELRNN